MLNLREARRRLVSLVNGYLMPRMGIKLVRSRPKTMHFRRIDTKARVSRVAVSDGDRGVEVQLREGTSDWMTFDQIFIDEDYDLRTLPRYADLTRQYDEICSRGATPLIVDLGANIGLSALYFALRYPRASVVAVEPDPDNFALLCKNVAQIETIEPLHAGIASKPGTLRIMDPDAGKNAVRTTTNGSDARGVEIDAVTMAAIVDRARSKGAIPFIAKIDIEGAEGELFSANSEWIDDFPLMIVELHDWLFPQERTAQNFLRVVAGRDRDFVYADENIFSIRNYRAHA